MCIGIPTINLRRSDDRLRFIMGNHIPIKWCLLGKQNPRDEGNKSFESTQSWLNSTEQSKTKPCRAYRTYCIAEASNPAAICDYRYHPIGTLQYIVSIQPQMALIAPWAAYHAHASTSWMPNIGSARSTVSNQSFPYKFTITNSIAQSILSTMCSTSEIH